MYYVLLLYLYKTQESTNSSPVTEEMSSCLETFGEGGRETGQGGMKGKKIAIGQRRLWEDICLVSRLGNLTVLEKSNVM